MSPALARPPSTTRSRWFRLPRTAEMLVITTASMAFVLAAGQSPAYADEPDSVASSTSDAIQSAAPEVLDSALPVTVDPTSSIPLTAMTAEGTVTAPKNPDVGVALDPSNGPAVQVGLPNAASSSDAVAVDDGIVAYDSGASTNVVVANEDGATVLATLKDGSAPERYDYPLTLTAGQTIQDIEDGGYAIIDPDGKTLAMTIAPAWAKDANGTAVPAHYERNGDTITMVVEHRSGNFAYPISADPSFSYGWTSVTVYLNRWETKQAIGWGSALIGLFLPATRVVQVLTTLLGLPATQAAASWMVDRGYCLAVTKYYWSTMPSPWVYRC